MLCAAEGWTEIPRVDTADFATLVVAEKTPAFRSAMTMSAIMQKPKTSS